jgi:hypothetical protein
MMIKRHTELGDLEFSIRTYNALNTAGYLTAGQIADATDSELLKVPNFGKVCLKEVRETIGLIADDSEGTDQVIEHAKTLQETLDIYQTRLSLFEKKFNEKQSAISRDLYYFRKELSQLESVKSACYKFIDYANKKSSEILLNNEYSEKSWRKIEDAPLDGTKILIVTEINNYYVAWFDTLDGVSGWYFVKGLPHLNDEMILAWRPLPLPPEKLDQAKG